MTNRKCNKRLLAIKKTGGKSRWVSYTFSSGGKLCFLNLNTSGLLWELIIVVRITIEV